MNSIENFFKSWGYINCTGPDYRRGDSPESSNFGRFLCTGKNLLDCLPIVGVISAIFVGIKFNQDKHVSYQLGMITHSIIGVLGGAAVCCALDLTVTVVRAVAHGRQDSRSNGLLFQ